MLHRVDPRLLIVLAAVLFSTGGAAIKATELGAWQVAALRSGIAFVALLLLVPAARAGWSWRIVPVALAYAATLTLFVLANKLTTAANTIFLQATAPLYVLVLGPLLLREAIRRADLTYMLVLAVGLALFFVSVDTASTTAPSPLAGNALAALSGVAWALTLLGLRWAARHAAGNGAAAAATLGNLLTFLVCAAWAFPLGDVSVVDWWTVIYLGVIQIALAYALFTAAMNRVPAFEASLLILVEPVLNPVWAWLVHAERPGALALLGGAIILAATLVRTLHQRRVSANG